MRFFLFSIFLILSALVSCSVAAKNPVCDLPHSADGSNGLVCYAYMRRWSFDSVAKKCVQFIYGGCGGNDNRFDSHWECGKTCLDYKFVLI